VYTADLTECEIQNPRKDILLDVTVNHSESSSK